MNVSGVVADLQAVQRRIAELSVSGLSADSVASVSPPRVSGSAFATVPSAASASLRALIEHSGAQAGVDPALIRAVIARESAFDTRARSSAGAMGLMQLMPSTAADLGVSDPYDPGQNVLGGARYLRRLLDRFGGDVRLALAAYNAGPGAVERYDGVPPFTQTRAYVRDVLGTYHALGRR